MPGAYMFTSSWV